MKYTRNNGNLIPIKTFKINNYVGVGETEGKRPQVKPRSRWVNNIKPHLGGERRGVTSIGLVKARDQ
jgi:hypothetical protein